MGQEICIGPGICVGVFLCPVHLCNNGIPFIAIALHIL